MDERVARAPTPVRVVKPVSLVDAIADDMRRTIYAGALAGGAQLTEAEIANTYAVARPTAKAAIEKLVSEALLLRGPHKTAQVATLNADDLDDLYFSRWCLESNIVRMLAEQRLVPQAAIEADRQTAAVGEPATYEVIEPIVGFHSSLVAAVNSPRMSRLFSSLAGEMRLCMIHMGSESLRQSPQVLEEHAAILDRIQAGDVEGALATLRQHLYAGEARLMPMLKAN
jgi:DNA-binding GntR family transcriptional regulator